MNVFISGLAPHTILYDNTTHSPARCQQLTTPLNNLNKQSKDCTNLHNQHVKQLTNTQHQPQPLTISSIFDNLLSNSPSQLLSSFTVYINNTFIDTSHYTTLDLNTFNNISNTYSNPNQTATTISTLPLLLANNISPPSPSPSHDILIKFIPKLLGGKGGFGNSLRGVGTKKKLPDDDSNMRNARGQRVGIERDRELLREFEHQLAEEARGAGRKEIRKVTLDKDNNRRNGSRNIVSSNSTTTTSQNQSKTERHFEIKNVPLNSHTAIGQLSGTIVTTDSNVLIGSDGVTTQTASELVNLNYSTQDALAKGLAKVNNITTSSLGSIPSSTDVSPIQSNNISTPLDSPPNTTNTIENIQGSPSNDNDTNNNNSNNDSKVDTTVISNSITPSQPSAILSRYIKPTGNAKASSGCGIEFSDEDDDDDDEDDE